MYRTSFHAAVLWISCTALLVCGCALGPRQIDHSRLRYNEAVQRTFQEEMLLNLVRLKYRDAPEFLSVGGIAAQYTFEGSAATGLTLPDGGTKVLGLDGAIKRSERPTISYTPARGEEFQKGLLAPIDIASLQLVARTGWSWERILRTTVQYMNEVDNATSAGGPTPDVKPDFEEFRYLAQLLRHMQKQRHVELVEAERPGIPRLVPLPRQQLGGEFVVDAVTAGYNFRETPDGLELFKFETYNVLVVHPAAKHAGTLQELARILKLDADWKSQDPTVIEVEAAKEGQIQSMFNDVVKNEDGTIAGGRTKIVLSTRSLLESMYYLSQGVVVPQEHMIQGLVTNTVDQQGQPFDWQEMTGDLFTVCCADHCPKNAAVAVKYKDYWFYIDDRDLNSQSTFTLLIELFGIEVRGGGAGRGFFYTLNVGD